MKVYQLIDRLQQFDNDMDVVYFYDSAPRGDIDDIRVAIDAMTGKPTVLLAVSNERGLEDYVANHPV